MDTEEATADTAVHGRLASQTGPGLSETGQSGCRACANCQAQLLGPHCHQCGQPVKGLVRHFSSIIGDLTDTLLALDSRIWRTLAPLLVRPGFLTLEYLQGRRVRYVSPVRLFIFLCLITFFVLRLTTSWESSIVPERVVMGEFASVESVEEVEALRQQTLDGLDQAIDGEEQDGVSGAVRQGLIAARDEVNRQAERRIAELDGTLPKDLPGDSPTLPGIPDSVDEAAAAPGDSAWTRVEAFSPGVNATLTGLLQRLDVNARLIRDDPNLFREALISAIPTMLLVLLPVFSLMLWVLYVFERRLYMEHLIVALHSHAFLCLALLLLEFLAEMEQWLAVGMLRGAMGWAGSLLLLWMPLYLLVMQKRVYGQGWGMTLAKYGLLGILYFVLLAFATTVTALLAIANL